MLRTGLERARTGTRAGWLTVIGIVMVPLAIGGLLILGLWKPTERLDGITAAVVNLDEPVELEGQTVPLGRQLAAGLVTGADDAPAGEADSVAGSNSNENFTWVLTDADDAEEGLADGTYATVVTIPEEFSAAATSYAGDAADAEQATVDITTSERSRLVDDAVSQAVTSTAVTLLNEQLTTTYLENIYVGFNTLGEQLGEAADGADQLADGVTELGSGADQLADGVGQLGGGARELGTGLQQIADGVSDGAAQARAGLPQARQFADGVARLAGASAQIGGGARTAAGFADDAAATSQDMARQLGALLQGCTPPAIPAPNCAGIFALAEDMGITTEAPPRDSLLYQTGAAAAATSQLSAGLNQPQRGQPSFVQGLTAAAGGADQIVDGLAQSAAGSQQIADAIRRTATGANALANGADASATGATKLADGATKLGDGVGELADGLGEATEQLPTYTESERTQLADVVAAPVAADRGDTELFGASSIPFFATLALWLGGLATFLLLAAIPHRVLGSTRSPVRLALGAYLPALGIGLAQGLVVGLAMTAVLGLDFGGSVGFVGFAMLAGAAFAAVNQGLVALFGGVGRFVSMLIAILGLATAVVSTVPPAFDAVLGVLPIAPGFDGALAIVNGAPGVGAAVASLVVWLLVGLGASVAAVVRRRTVDVRKLEHLPAGV